LMLMQKCMGQKNTVLVVFFCFFVYRSQYFKIAMQKCIKQENESAFKLYKNACIGVFVFFLIFGTVLALYNNKIFDREVYSHEKKYPGRV